MPDDRRLKRTTGLPGALLIGLGAILGTGVFVSLALAAAPAGQALPQAVLLAALLAGANGLSSAQLAAAMPVSGGSYEYARRLLTPAVGFTAGWLFLCAKTASAAAAALGLAGYLMAMGGWETGAPRWLPPLLVLALTLAAMAGLRRSQRLNLLLVAGAVAALLVFGIGALRSPPLATAALPAAPLSPAGLAEATALVFVAFTGYGRIATMGEEVRGPGRTIPRAMLLTLAVVLGLYLLVSAAALHLAGPVGFAAAIDTTRSASPLATLLERAGWTAGSRVVAVGASLALAGVLLNLILGLSRVWLAMARQGDMPAGLARLDRGGHSPVRAVVWSGICIACLTLPGQFAPAWTFSAFTVLGYYLITNLCALRLPPVQRRFPPLVAWVGMVGCAGLAFRVDTAAWITGLVVVLAGLLWFRLRRRRSPSSTS